MGIWLTMTTGDGRERPFPINGHRMVIGRDCRCDVQVSLPTVAPRHCEIAIEGALLTVRDLGSAGGTLRNGQRVDQAVLEHGDQVTVGRVTFVVQVGDDRAMLEPAAQPPEADAALVDPPAAGP